MPDATSTDPPDPAVAPRGLTESEDLPWTRKIPNHPPRKDSPAYVAARSLMNKLALGLAGFLYGDKPFEDHHGGGLWLKDEQGWFVVRNIAGIEWSAQFCADPAKVDLLRQNARRLYDKFPDAVAELGIRDLLDTPIKDAAGVAVWTDSICNASVPLPAQAHRGILPAFGGIHHYPAPVAEIAFFKYDDFDLWVTDAQGNEVAVTPAAPRGSGNGQVQVLDAPASSTLAAVRTKAREQNQPAVVPATDRVAEEAYGEQYAKLATGTVAPDDPLAAAALPGPDAAGPPRAAQAPNPLSRRGLRCTERGRVTRSHRGSAAAFLLGTTMVLACIGTGPAAAQAGGRMIPASALVAQIRAGQTVDEQDVTVSGTVDLRSIPTVARPIRCLDCDFTGKLIAPDVVFTRVVVLSGGHFFDTVDLRGAVFQEGLFLRTSSRPAELDRFSLFSLATFGTAAAFDGATFMDEGNFTSARFLGEASFVGTNFRGVARFTQASFEGSALFSGTQVPADHVSVPTCAVPIGGTFGTVAVFARAVFAGEADFRQRCFARGADFRSATFQSRANFSLGQLNGLAAFDDASFQGDALFLATRFGARASFVRVAAARSLDFEDADFHGISDLSGVAVSGSLSFRNTSFGGAMFMPNVIAGDIEMDPSAVQDVVGVGNRVHALGLIEASSKNRGELAVANEAHYELLSLENDQASGVTKWLDAAFYRGIAGYLVRPMHPLGAFLILLALAGFARAVTRRRREGKRVRSHAKARAAANPRPPPARRPATHRLKGAPLVVVKWLSAIFEGVGDTVGVAFRRKAQVELGDPEQVRSYVAAGIRWSEYLAFKVLIALFVLCLASSNATLRQLLNSVTGS